MPKLKPFFSYVSDEKFKLYDVGDQVGWSFKCPGCDDEHRIHCAPFRSQNEEGSSWTFNGNIDCPTFHPSINARYGPFPDSHYEICHSFVEDGNIRFLQDSTHSLAGQTIELPNQYCVP